MQTVQATILADGRWIGAHGIGRFSTEILSRLKNATILREGPKPLSLKNLLWQQILLKKKWPHQVFFTPGFNPVLSSSLPYVLTIHDLIHLQFPGAAKWLKKIYYNTLIKQSIRNAHTIFTVSAYSKQQIIDWTGMAEEKIVIVASGVSEHFHPQGERYRPGFEYLLHVGNTKEHKNVTRLIQAFASADIDKNIKLICTGSLSESQLHLIKRLGLQKRIFSHSHLSENKLATYYRGALGVVFPSLCEGFGLPILEGMASGVPVLTSSVASMPEVAGEAALLVEPYHVDAIAEGITHLVNQKDLREKLIMRGLLRSKLFSWDMTAQHIQSVLDQV